MALGRGRLVVAAAFAVALQGVATAKESPCTGRFVVRNVGGPLLAGGPADLDVVDLTAASVRLRSGCSPSPVAARPMKKGGGSITSACTTTGSRSPSGAMPPGTPRPSPSA